MPEATKLLGTFIVCSLLCFQQMVTSSIAGQQPQQLDIDDVAEDIAYEINEELRQQTDVADDSVPWYAGNELALVARSTNVSGSQEPRPRDCADLFDQGHLKNDVYTIYLGHKRRPLRVYCDMTSNGGGWTVFQRRLDGSKSFWHGWGLYADGFGLTSGEHWLGNNNIHALTLDRQFTLRVEITDFSGNIRYAEYNNFKLGAACDKYALLSLGAYCGNAGDSLTAHVGQKFTTYDSDNDLAPSYNCAARHRGGWWFSNCLHSNLNGLYHRGSYSATYQDGVTWNSFIGVWYSHMKTEMKLRPTSFSV